MPRSERARPRRIGARQAGWAAVAAILALALALSATTVANYTEIARAKVFAAVEIAREPAFAFDGAGGLESVSIRLTMTFCNPSGKELRAWIVTCKGWIRDIPAEQGNDTSRAALDDRVIINGTAAYFFPVFAESFSFDNPRFLVPPRSNVTVTRWVNATASAEPELLAGLEAILSHAGANGREAEWHHCASSIIMITDIPPYSGMNNDANLIRRFEGTDISQTRGGYR
jgi:hypothetical protein